MTSRRTRVMACLAAVVTVGLSGCGSEGVPQPGAAAVVNGESISVDELNEAVEGQCAYAEASIVAGTPGVSPTSVAQMRTQVLDYLVATTIVEQDIEARGLEIRASDVYEASEPLSLPKGMSGADKSSVEGFFERGYRLQVGVYLLSSHLLDPEVTSSADAEMGQVNNEYISNLVRGADVEVNPRYGTWQKAALVPESGSLSVPVSPLAQQYEAAQGSSSAGLADLPAAQRCG